MTVTPPADLDDPAVLFVRLGLALGLGLLIGLQRQRTDARLAGIRTFSLVTLLGAACGMLAAMHGGWILAAGLVAVAIVIVGGKVPQQPHEGEPPGLTSAIAVLIMFALGAYLMAGSTGVAIALGGAVVVLLHLKPQMHALAGKIEDRDFAAVVQFVVLSLIILPVLPNRTFGPFQVLNPYKIWLIVVLMVGMSLVGYITFKFMGSRAGAWASALLGGFVSSTAATVTTARANKESPGDGSLASFVILVACGISFVRLALLVAATAPAFLPSTLLALGTLFTVLFIAGWMSLRMGRSDPSPVVSPKNPAALKTPLLFGLLYAVMLLVIAAANEHFGHQGVYVAGSISGLTDMDAITLSVTNLVNAEKIPVGTGWRAIVVAAMANLVFKGSVVAAMGERRLVVRVWSGFAAAIAAGAALLYFGPI
jgi:uncharacterized membrane protein (DUF4010 family)